MDRLASQIALSLWALVCVTAAVSVSWGGLEAIVIGAAGAVALGVLASRGLDRRTSELSRSLRASLSGASERRLGWTRPRAALELANAVNETTRQVRERLEGAAAEQERLRAVLNSMVEGVLVLDREGKTLLANRRLQELFDAWGEVEGRSALELIRRPEIDGALSRVLEGEPVAEEIALSQDRRVEMHAVPFPAEGPLLGIVAVFHDVTEIRRLEGVRREFVANVSHELRTPLTAIRGFAETLIGSEAPREQRDQQVGVILRHSERLSALIEDLLELSRIEGRRAPIELRPIDVVALCQSALRDLGPRFDERSIQGSLQAETDRTALADPRSLEQVLLNLLDNALKYTEPGGEIRVSVREEGDRLRLDVVDTGMGIPEADLARVFERFYRVEKARTRDLGGTGLGLSIVKHLVQAMNGDVFIESNEGQGTTVSVLLPTDEPAASA